MARGFGERLGGAGQALRAFDQAYMQAKEDRLRQRDLRDAELLYNARNARSARMAQTIPDFMLADRTGGRAVAGLSVPQAAQPPAQRQPIDSPAPVTTAAAPATRLVGTMEPRQELRPMELQYRQGLTTQRPPYVNYTEAQEQQLAGMRQRRATINSELRYIDEQLRQIPTGGALGTGDTVLRQTYEAQKARLMREREALTNQLRGVTEDTSTRRFIPGAPGLSVPVPSTSALAVPFQTQPGQMTTPEIVFREEPAAAPAAAPKQQKAQDDLTQAAQKAPMGEGPTPEKLADTVAAATGGIMYGPDPEEFDVQATDFAVQQALTLRQNLAIQYEELVKRGFADRAMQIIPQIQAVDLGLYKAQGDRGVYEGITEGNWSRAVTVLSQFRGSPHQVLDRGDGTFDLYVNGQISDTGQTASDLADYFRYQLDESYRARKAEIAGKEYERQVELEKEVVKKVLEAQGDLQVAITNIQGELAKQEQKYGQVSVTSAGDGQHIIVQRGDNTFATDLQGNQYEFNGVQFTVPTTTRIPGIR